MDAHLGRTMESSLEMRDFSEVYMTAAQAYLTQIFLADMQNRQLAPWAKPVKIIALVDGQQVMENTDMAVDIQNLVMRSEERATFLLNA